MTHLTPNDIVMFAAVCSRCTSKHGSRSDLAFVASNMLHGGHTDEFKSEVQVWQCALDRLIVLGYVYQVNAASYEPTTKGRETFREESDRLRDLALRTYNAIHYNTGY